MLGIGAYRAVGWKGRTPREEVRSPVLSTWCTTPVRCATCVRRSMRSLRVQVLSDGEQGKLITPAMVDASVNQAWISVSAAKSASVW